MSEAADVVPGGRPLRARLRPWHARLTPQERRELLDELFFEGPELVPYLFRLGTLMALSTVIATLGLIADSSAVVIGAMLIAPLMTPLMAFSASLAVGWPWRQLQALVLVVLASCEAIGVAWLVSAVVPAFQPVFLSQELLSRTEPSLLNLAIAIVAGAAGAYVTAHRRAAGALPGVAIAVALIPPLAAVGVLVDLGDTHKATGALLLFLTNLVSIALAGAVAFLVSGFVPPSLSGRNGRRIRFGLVTALVAVGAVSYPLYRESERILLKAKDEQAVSGALSQWLGESALEVAAVDVSEHGREVSVTVDVTGAKPPPPAGPLAALIEQRIGRRVGLVVRWTEQRAEVANAG
jgi:uncharacterized hydrophobic protein (TIGR00271 family)